MAAVTPSGSRGPEVMWSAWHRHSPPPPIIQVGHRHSCRRISGPSCRPEPPVGLRHFHPATRRNLVTPAGTFA